MFRSLSEEEINTYNSDGAVLLRGMFSADWMVYLRAAMDDVRANPGKNARLWQHDSRQSEFYEEPDVASRTKGFKDFVCDSPMAQIAASLMQSTTARCVYDQVFIKQPGTVRGTHWHHDAPYFPARGEQVCVAWMPMEHLSKQNSLECLKGSHQSGQLYRFAEEVHKPIMHLPTTPPIAANRDDYDILTWEFEPGDVLLFHIRTLHGSSSHNNVSERRRALSTRWAGDDVRYTLKDRFSALNFKPDLQEGDPLDDPRFPLVWPR
jgi:ectoine hydroxylase-related dioxygenase (phytanoyl-CoA dioxygenase family)